jgi:hypothetical protein
MTWYPTAFLPTQIEDSAGAPRNGAVLKAYAAGTNTPIPMATDYTGLTTAASFVINSLGYPSYQGTIIIPHIQENYKMALYPDQASADANSGAVWTIDDNQIALSTNSPFTQYFDGDGVNNVFTLSQDFGTDPKVLLVFADRAIVNYASNTDFATDTIWTKGAGWTISAGVANAAGALSTAISQVAAVPIIQGQSYTVEFTVTASAGTLTPSVGGNAGTTRGAGTWRETIIAGSTQVLAFTGVGFTGTLDNATIKATAGGTRVINRPDEMTLNGNQLTLNNIPTAGTKNVIVFSPSSLIGAAQASAEAAALSEANALIYQNQAEIYATALNGTSTTSVSIGTGSKSFTTQADKQFSVGNWLTITSAADTDNYMFGQVTAYNPTTGALTVDVTEIAGSAGPFADWNISISGIKGVNGTVPDGSISNIKQADMPAGTFKGNNTALPAAPIDLTAAQMGTALGCIRSRNVIRVTSSGTYTKPSNLVMADVRCIAAGGGGNSNGTTGGAGGGGGGTSRSLLLASQIAATETMTIGAGGAAGGNGGQTSFGSLVVANGGTGVTSGLQEGGQGGSLGTGQLGSEGGDGGCASSAASTMSGYGGATSVAGNRSGRISTATGNAGRANTGQGGSGGWNAGGGAGGSGLIEIVEYLSS